MTSVKTLLREPASRKPLPSIPMAYAIMAGFGFTFGPALAGIVGTKKPRVPKQLTAADIDARAATTAHNHAIATANKSASAQREALFKAGKAAASRTPNTSWKQARKQLKGLARIAYAKETV